MGAYKIGGLDHSVLVASDGKVYSWGDDRLGALGRRQGTQSAKLGQISSLDHVIITKVFCSSDEII